MQFNMYYVDVNALNIIPHLRTILKLTSLYKIKTGK